ncbi:MAG: hypothetical protein RLZZ518_749 [Actinomycetota bacterium]
MSTSTTSRKLRLEDILDHRAYERIRDARRAEVIELKRRRRLHLGTVVTVSFENRATMHNQIQEMLRVERVVTDEGVNEELKAFNPMIPEPGQLCATLFVELTTEDQMREWLPKLVGIEKSIVVHLADGTQVRGIVDEQHAEGLTRETVTAAVHYLRFEFTPEQIATFAKGGVQLRCDLSNYLEAIELPDFTVAELLTDLRDDS